MNTENINLAVKPIYTEFDYIELGNEFAANGVVQPSLDCEFTKILSSTDKSLEVYNDDFVVKASADLTLEELDLKLQSYSKMTVISAPAKYKVSRILGEMFLAREKRSVLGLDLLHLDSSESKTGGQVIKNVAGYDLRRLYLGSFNSLALIRSAYLRLEKTPMLKMTMSQDFETLDDIDFNQWRGLTDFDVNQVESRLLISKDFAYEGALPFILGMEFYGTPDLLEMRKQRVLEKTALDLNVLMSPFKKVYPSEKQFTVHFSLTYSALKAFSLELAEILQALVKASALLGYMELDLLNASVKLFAKPSDFDVIRESSFFIKLNEKYRPVIRIRPLKFENRLLERTLNLALSQDELEIMQKIKVKFDPEGRLNPGLLV